MALVTTTRVSAYVEFDGGIRRRATEVAAHVEKSPSTDVHISSVEGYTELSPDTKVKVSNVAALRELAPVSQARASRVSAYVEFVPTTGTTTPNAYVADTDSNAAKVAGMVGIVGVQNRETLLSQLAVYAELTNGEVDITKFINLVELSLDNVRVTKFVTLIELDPVDPDNGLIIVGNHRSWRDIYPKNITDIPISQAYRFILDSSGLSMIDLAWDDVEDEDGYEIERSPNGTTGWTLEHTTGPDVTNYVSILLQPNTTYYYRIRSFNEGGYSAYSDVISETTRAIQPSLLAQRYVTNSTDSVVYIDVPDAIQAGDFMIMQIGVEDSAWVETPAGWTLEAIVPGIYDNIILSRTRNSGDPAAYAITRTNNENFVVSVALYAWDASDSTIVFFDS